MGVVLLDEIDYLTVIGMDKVHKYEVSGGWWEWWGCLT